ncbi:MAG: N-acetylmuramoyl-L-alanine amidase [Gammaproteobacteria bacterium]|nr:N-acetylmuramoyl-L-alanine amidase [Gammaproteobacteria bacterium]
MKIDKQGWALEKKITKEHRPAIEHGNIATINSLVLHRTGSTNAKSVLNAWDNKREGTHFLISESGDIYQPACLTKKCWHVGKLYSRCRTIGNCSKEEAAVVESILQKKNTSWGKKFRLVTQHELKKSYPHRFPHNHDSLGIEIVGVLSRDREIYEIPDKRQLDSLFWLIDALAKVYSLSPKDIYTHGKIAHKDRRKSEGTASLKAYALYLSGK